MSWHKIGHDVFRYEPKREKQMGIVYTGNLEYREKALQVLKESERPLSINEVRKAVGIKTWITAKSVLMELVFNGYVECFRSGRALLFRIKKE